MASAGIVYQDCHGEMTQVGNDFSKNVSPSNPGAFVLNGSLRVPWANEPHCGSCHTGDALSNLTNTVNVIKAPEGIRLLQAFRTDDPNAIPIIPSNRRFAEDQVGNQQVLYRLSNGGTPLTVNGRQVGESGHGRVFCEGCHGSTHAEWPVANPNANDNVQAKQLQGHTGVIIECGACHANANLGVTLNGPHGLHPVGSTSFSNGGHENLARSNPDACRACHGRKGEGTVLSEAHDNRSLSREEGGVVRVTKGQKITGNLCHSNPLGGGSGN